MNIYKIFVFSCCQALWNCSTPDINVTLKKYKDVANKTFIYDINNIQFSKITLTVKSNQTKVK